MSRRNRDGLGSSWEDSRGEFYQEHFPSAQAGMQPHVPVPRSRAREQPLGSTQLELLNSLPSRQLLHTVDGETGLVTGCGVFGKGAQRSVTSARCAGAH